MSDEFDKLLKTSGFQLSEARKGAVDWIRDKISQLRNTNRRTDQTNIFQKNALPEIGGMYLFSYDPKHKNTLPFWDSHPLVIPIEYYADGFLGINLHYLPPNARIALLQELSKVTNNDKFDRSTRMNISYRYLKGMSVQLSGDNGVLKRYLFSHARSSFHQVSAAEWGQAAMLPIQRWVQNSNVKLRKSPPY